MSAAGFQQDKTGFRLQPEDALRVARLDAERAYRDLSEYSVTVHLEKDGYHVDYELGDREAHGGGPHYVIHAESGKILSKRYEQ